MSERAVAGIALGANLGERERTLKRALSLLEREPGVVLLRRSRWFATEPVGGPAHQPEFLNGAALLETTLSPEALLRCLQAIEQQLGRDRSTEVHHGPRPIDLDLLWYGDERRDSPELTLPHPGLEQRLFVLDPLCDVAPEQRLARSGLTVRERAAELRAQAGGAAQPLLGGSGA